MIPQDGDFVLTIRQPWAWMVVTGHKPIENRPVPTRHRGLLWIHAAKAAPDEKWKKIANTEFGIPEYRLDGAALWKGAIIGSVQIADCFDVLDVPPIWTGNVHCQGQFCYVLTDPKPLPVPIPYIGKLGMFKFRQT